MELHHPRFPNRFTVCPATTYGISTQLWYRQWELNPYFKIEILMYWPLYDGGIWYSVRELNPLTRRERAISGPVDLRSIYGEPTEIRTLNPLIKSQVHQPFCYRSIGDLAGIRIQDPVIKSHVLCLLSYKVILVQDEGLEPPTLCL